MTKLKTIAKNSDIDWSSAIYMVDTGTRLSHDFELSPIDFLNFARNDLSTNTPRNIVNSLSNAKRCIDCETDKFLAATNINLKSSNTLDFIRKHPFVKSSDAPIKLQLLQALNIAPIGVISKYRKFRHNLEHDYRLPKYDNALEAIDIAHMFMGCIDNYLNVFIDNFNIGSKKNPIYTKEQRFLFTLIISFDANKGFEITSFHPTNPRKSCKILNSDPEYIPLLQISISLGLENNLREAHSSLVDAMGLTIPKKTHKPKMQFA